MKEKKDLLALLVDSNKHVADRKWVGSIKDALRWAEAASCGYGYEVAVYTISGDQPIFHRVVETLWSWQNRRYD